MNCYWVTFLVCYANVVFIGGREVPSPELGPWPLECPALPQQGIYALLHLVALSCCDRGGLGSNLHVYWGTCQ